MPFSSIITQIQSKVEADINAHIAAVGTTLADALIEATPVKTGRARSNWHAALGHRDSQYTPEPGSGADAESQIAQVCAQFDITQHGSLWLMNNAPYIGKLDRGRSHQAAAGYIEAIIADVRTKV